MKVNIITRHAIPNYGSILQAHATQKLFESIGCESKIIDYIPEDEKMENILNTYISNSGFWKKNSITKLGYKVLQKRNILNMNKKFEEFRKHFLKLTSKTCYNTEELRKEIEPETIYCTGSDQVWGKIGTQEYDKNYFLDFVPKENKCISYAASFGKGELCKEEKDNLNELTKKYSSILVRENSAVDILKKAGCSNVEQVLDPTLTMSKEYWESICLDNQEKKPYILIYQLHHNKDFDKFAKKVSKETGLRLIRINPSIYFKLKPGKLKYLPTPEEFITYVKNAEYVLTDSFHGTVFSILLNKKFVDILPKTTGARILSILELFGIKERLITDYNNTSILKEDINYEYVHKKLDEERNKSIEELKKSLNN